MDRHSNKSIFDAIVHFGGEILVLKLNQAGEEERKSDFGLRDRNGFGVARHG
jgi:hypothetical protein